MFENSGEKSTRMNDASEPARRGEQKYPEPAVSALIIAPTGQVLFIQSPKWGNRWSLPAGHVELGERTEDAIVREVKEETGLDVKPIELLTVQEAVFPVEFHERRHFISIDYLCRVQDPRIELDGLELHGCLWVDPDEALDLDMLHLSRNVLVEYLARIAWLEF